MPPVRSIRPYMLLFLIRYRPVFDDIHIIPYLTPLFKGYFGGTDITVGISSLNKNNGREVGSPCRGEVYGYLG